MANIDSKNGKFKGRFFAAVTYITDSEELLKYVQAKQNSIRAYAMILHDKDDADPHYHMVLRTHTTWAPLQVAKWFESPSGQNTLVQLVRDRTGIIDYLTHENEDDKFHYDKSLIIDGGLSDILPAGETNDDSYEIVERLIAGESIRELVRLYGRDFVYHFASYAAIVSAIRDQEQ